MAGGSAYPDELRYTVFTEILRLVRGDPPTSLRRAAALVARRWGLKEWTAIHFYYSGLEREEGITKPRRSPTVAMVNVVEELRAIREELQAIRVILGGTYGK